MKDMSEEQIKQILKVLAANGGDYERTGRDLLLKADVIREVDIVVNKKYNATPRGMGPRHMEKYIVATTSCNRPWDPTDPKIIEARKAYEAGTHTMTTGRDGITRIMYLIPLRKKARSNNYFSELKVI